MDINTNANKIEYIFMFIIIISKFYLYSYIKINVYFDEYFLTLYTLILNDH